MRRNRGILFVVSAPSGAGKTTLCRRVLRMTRGLTRSVSWTTRPPRGREVNGRDYRFVSEVDFRRMAARKKFAEWAVVYGRFYGTPKEAIAAPLREGRDVLLNIDVQGARSIRRLYGRDAVTIFLMPPSMTELRRRLVDRNQDSRGTVTIRLRKALEEISRASTFDYIVLNDSLKDAEEQLRSIITAERQRTARITLP